MLAGFDAIFELAENSANAARKAAKSSLSSMLTLRVVYVMSSGASAEVAYSTSICLMMEMQWINSGSFPLRRILPRSPSRSWTRTFPSSLLMNDGKTRSVDARALTFLNRFDALTTVVDAKDYGLGGVVPSNVATFFDPMLHTARLPCPTRRS